MTGDLYDKQAVLETRLANRICEYNTSHCLLLHSADIVTFRNNQVQFTVKLNFIFNTLSQNYILQMDYICYLTPDK